VTRRPLLLIASIAAVLALVIGACSNAASQAPALTDPKEILTQSVLSIKDVKTVEIVGALSGKLDVAELGGSLDLSSTTIAAAADIPNQKAQVKIDAPTLLGTKLDAIVVDGVAYVKIDGPLAGMAGFEAGKYVKQDVPEASDKPVTDPAELDKQIDEFQKQLDELPNPPTKEADEKCGDQDCYHVQIKASAEDMKELDPQAGSMTGDVTIDWLARKSDLRPAKLTISIATPDMGTLGITLDFKYDGSVNISAPPADQVVEQ
jgi:hypothetical protein